MALNDCYFYASPTDGKDIFSKRDFLSTVVSLLNAPSVRLRLQAMWVIGNAGASNEAVYGLKRKIINIGLVDAIVQVFFGSLVECE